VISAVVPSPFGPLSVQVEGDAIVRLAWGDDGGDHGGRAAHPALEAARDQLTRYFAGTLTTFALPLAPQGTAFQRRVWDALLAIPYGALRSYGEVARDLRSVARAVGQACGANPIPIIVPCHRVLAENGGIGGFSGFHGTDSKRFLLALEGARPPALPLSIPAHAPR
jgi:methylated-DNA-[protein]-cysteine S-methyltransferase